MHQPMTLQLLQCIDAVSTEKDDVTHNTGKGNVATSPNINLVVVTFQFRAISE